ncbi:hypothetical protein QMK33_13980 [Hymenobacter sp. H14-R3]|uniref:hypothetical protein n=1 Tax=Hymenobacter sp. H14-R3 TaxID=3046308 RepID=UPI0024BA05C8|nr:hypothetical protein [Hymenobacter sp. H14-R3]MDJ0366264.1 hypothetical protein [Hymenobacter sp. H14-R3]
MTRITILRLGLVLAGLPLAAGCRIATSRAPERKAAVRANAISNKHILTESPTLERPAPKVVPGP